MKTLLLIPFSLLLISCGTRKTESREQKDVRLEESFHLIESSVMGITITDSLGEKLRREKVYKITILSRPDSMGYQYPLIVEEGTVTEDYAADRVIGRDSTGMINRKEDGNILLEDKSRVKEKTGIDTRLIPVWVWWFLMVGGVIGALLWWRRRRSLK